MNVFSNFFYKKVKQSNIEENDYQEKEQLIDLLTLDSSYDGLFKKSMVLVNNKIKYWIVVIGCSLFSFITVYALFSENYILFFLNPIARNIINYITQNYYTELLQEIQDKWKTIVLEYFHSLPHKSRRKTIMKDFERQIDRSSWVFGRTVQSIIPQITEFIIDCITILYAIYMYFALDAKAKDNSFLHNTFDTLFLIGCVLIAPAVYYIYI